MFWDLRASWEAQLRSMSALQCCVEEYRQTGDPNTLTETARHLDAVAERHRAGHDPIEQARETLFMLMRTTQSW